MVPFNRLEHNKGIDYMVLIGYSKISILNDFKQTAKYL